MDLPENLESCYLDMAGRSVHYVASTVPVEPVPAVVLVHGVGLSHRYMIPTARRLAEEFRTYVPDLPGFGKSYKPQRVLTITELADSLAEWMGALGLEQAVLLGNSVGCQVIVDLAVRHPRRVQRAILQGPTVDPGARTFPQQMWRWYRNRNQERSTEKGGLVVRDYWECGLRRLVQTFRHSLEDKIEEKLPRMHCPTLVVRGLLDPIVPQRWAEEVTRLLPRGRLVVLPGIPHTANLEGPLELMRVIRPFLEEARRSSAESQSGTGPSAGPQENLEILRGEVG